MFRIVEDLCGSQHSFQVPKIAMTETLIVAKTFHRRLQRDLNLLSDLDIIMGAQGGQTSQANAWCTVTPGKRKNLAPFPREAKPVALLRGKKASLIRKCGQCSLAEAFLLAASASWNRLKAMPAVP